MKKASLLLILTMFCAVMFLSGCCKEPTGFVADVRPGLTSCEAKSRVCRSVYFNGQMAWEDWDHFWMIERPSTLNWLRINQYSTPSR